MLSSVLALLQDRQWFDISQPYEKSINLTRGACIWMLLTRQGVSDTYVKFTDCMDLLAEAQRCESASRSYPRLVPAFVGHARVDGLDVLVCRALDYLGLNTQQLERESLRRRVLDGLVPYFAAQPGVSVPATLTPMSNATLLANLAAYFDGHALGSLAACWLGAEAAQRATGLPDVPQHSDLVLNNIGLRKDGALVIFDWEDFGACCLPGLDLFTLELALAGHVGPFFDRRQQPAHPTQAFVRQACSAMGLAPADYHALTPVYALVFRYLKRNYGPGVRERMDQLLLDIDRRPSQAA